MSTFRHARELPATPESVFAAFQSEFLEIVPNAVVRLKHINPPHFELSISLEPSATGTLVSWVGVFENREFAENRRRFLKAANEQNLDRLAMEVSSG